MKTDPVLKPTARELLETAAGKAHALHSVMRRKSTTRTLSLICSCGETFKIPFSAAAKTALRNVPEIS